MKFPVIRKSYFLNILILLFSLFISWYTLLFGTAHLVEFVVGGKQHPNIPYYEIMIGWIMVVLICGIGIIFLLIAIASIKGIVFNIKKKRP